MLKVKDLQSGELPLGPEGLVAWLQIADCGETISYYRGSLCNDRGFLSTNRASVISTAADIMLAASEAGFINILQVRRGEGDYIYVAKRADVEFRAEKLLQSMDEISNRRKELVKKERARERDVARKKARRQMEPKEGNME
jgi:hypothetical protein